MKNVHVLIRSAAQHLPHRFGPIRLIEKVFPLTLIVQPSYSSFYLLQAPLRVNISYYEKISPSIFDFLLSLKISTSSLGFGDEEHRPISRRIVL